MNITRQIILTACVTALLVGGVTYWFMSRNTSEIRFTPQNTSSTHTDTDPKKEDGYDMKVVNDAKEDKKMSLYLEYPQFKRVNSAFNSKIKNYILQSKKEFEAATAENYTARVETGTPEERARMEADGQSFGQYIAKWESVQNNASTLSFVIRVYSYTGGANGSESIQTFNYNFDTNTEITLQSLFPKDAAYLSKIARLVQSKAREEMRNRSGGELYEEGLTPSDQNYANFTVSPKGITFYYPKYSIAAGAYGDFEFFVGFDEVAAMK